MLLEQGALPNALNRSGQTPLMLACKSGCGTCIEPLLKAGANILGFNFSDRVFDRVFEQLRSNQIFGTLADV
ncbi:unnamed protein product [Calypogeia fissa]